MPYGGNPATSQADQLRLWIGDTDAATPLLTDGEVDFFLQIGGNPLAGAISACKALIARYSHLCDEEVDKVDVKWSQLVANLKNLLPTLEAELNSKLSEPMWAGGISIADKATREADSDRVPPSFTRDMMSEASGYGSEVRYNY